MHPPFHHQSAPCAVQRWLLICMAMVVLMVLVGGLTRLTESGLSMVEWKPQHVLPPMNDAEWAEEFGKYQQSPEYQKVNIGMDVAGFQRIFWLEYIHRLLARTVGIVFFLPLVWFAIRKQISRPMLLKLAGIFALGGAQGLMGWVMVHSGLQNNPWVNPVKLAMHLSLAITIFALILWQFLTFSTIRTHAMPPQSHATPAFPQWLKPALWGTLGLVGVQIILGALVAGMDAGMVYNSYPTMDGQWIPDGLHTLAPWWRNWVENVTAIQFHHRLGAHVVAAVVLALAVAIYRLPNAAMLGRARHGLTPVMVAQFLLGILTLLWQVPISLASAHQLGAVALVGVLVALLHRVHGCSRTPLATTTPSVSSFGNSAHAL